MLKPPKSGEFGHVLAFGHGFDREAVRCHHGTVVVLMDNKLFPDFDDASPKNTNWAGAPTSDYRKLQIIFF